MLRITASVISFVMISAYIEYRSNVFFSDVLLDAFEKLASLGRV